MATEALRKLEENFSRQSSSADVARELKLLQERCGNIIHGEKFSLLGEAKNYQYGNATFQSFNFPKAKWRDQI